MTKTSKEITLECLIGARNDVVWPAHFKLLQKFSSAVATPEGLSRLGNHFGLMHKLGEGCFTLQVFSTPPCAIDFDSAQAVIDAGWRID